MIAAGANAKALSVVMGHAGIEITFNRYGHLMPGSEAQVGGQLNDYLGAAAVTNLPTDLPMPAPQNDETRSQSGLREYRHGGSNPGFRRERAAS